MARILVVDDEDKIRLIIRKYAEMEGHQVTEAKDGIEAVSICALEDFDVMILDVMMPGMDGFAVCKQVRRYKKIPVIMLSARGEEYDRIKGFELGIDDYVVKPFSPKELMCRVRVVVQRNQAARAEYTKRVADTTDDAETRDRGQACADPEDMPTRKVYQQGDLVVDFTGRSVMVEGKSLDLTPKEYDLLFYLVENRNIALSRDQLITNVWGYDYYGDDRTLDTHIKRLRSNLGKYRGCIVTLRGVGYRFDDRI